MKLPNLVAKVGNTVSALTDQASQSVVASRTL